ncbi:MAG TPA: hypothetical protein PLZ15_11740 [Melioribacteraceae bacterium]|nr:hypothetical protein [Melioribacteraceae bacterium]
MTELSSLWLPILVSAITVFIVSSIVHMVLPWHKGEYPKIPDQDKVMDVLRPFNIPPGEYMVPRAGSMAEMKSQEYKDKLNKGPVMIVTVLPNGERGMGKYFLLWFIYSIVVGIFAAYIAGRALPPDAHYLQVFRFVGASAFMGYSFAYWPMHIWYHKSFRSTLTSTIDGLIYALFTAGVFGWLWPV